MWLLPLFALELLKPSWLKVKQFGNQGRRQYEKKNFFFSKQRQGLFMAMNTRQSACQFLPFKEFVT